MQQLQQLVQAPIIRRRDELSFVLASTLLQPFSLLFHLQVACFPKHSEKKEGSRDSKRITDGLD